MLSIDDPELVAVPVEHRHTELKDVSGFAGAVYVEFQGAQMGACTVIASFITFGEPFDRDVPTAYLRPLSTHR